MTLGKLITSIPRSDFNGDRNAPIKDLAYDSRQVGPGSVFVALRGRSLDGHEYIQDAVARGAVAIVAEGIGEIAAGVSTLRVPDSRAALSQLAVAFYAPPFERMNLVGITGTNGKTTTSYLLESILQADGRKTGGIGTVNYRFGGKVWPAPMTTPESLDLMRILRAMADEGVTDVVMEVSSHALDQGRTAGCPFQVAVFTNLTRDHLDYHPTMDAYFEAKSRLFTGLDPKSPKRPAAIINADDPRGPQLAAIARAEVITYGLREGCRVRADRLELSREGIGATLRTPAGSVDIRSSLIGHFNIYNIMAAASAALRLGVDPQTVSAGILRLGGVPGRLELVRNQRNLAIAVDYAHTPDALLKALESVKRLTRGRVLTVFGCGGDRDRGKRGEMGAVAARLSDVVVVTSDNPRTEDPDGIVTQIEAGLLATGMKRAESLRRTGSDARGYMVEPDRAKAIQRAVALAGKDDFILIAGKGHEDYQIVGKTKRHFDDREVAATAAGEHALS